MDSALLVDAVVVLSLVGALVAGASRGFGRLVGALCGALAGVAVVVRILPAVGQAVADHAARLVALVAVVVLVVSLGAAVGAAIGQLLRRALDRAHLGWLDSLAGAVTSTAVAALAWVLVTSSVAPLSPSLSDAVAGSRALHTLTAHAPRAVTDSGTLTDLIARGQPWVAEVAGGPTSPPEIPDVDVDAAAIRESARSVVRVRGNACDASVTGSGAVIAPGRIITNAHVVAGVDRPVVTAPGDLPVVGQVVYVDPKNDLAVIAADRVTAPPLDVDPSTRAGTTGVVAGYPLGGPLTLGAAEIISERRTMVTTDVGTSLRPILVLAAKVEHGNSGGPVLDADGDVVGVVFAKGTRVDGVGYAVPASVVRPLAGRAASLTASVDPGPCQAA